MLRFFRFLVLLMDIQRFIYKDVKRLERKKENKGNRLNCHHSDLGMLDHECSYCDFLIVIHQLYVY